MKIGALRCSYFFVYLLFLIINQNRYLLYYEDIFTGIYYVTHKKYSAFYRIRADRIEVGRVLYNRSAYISLVIKSMSEE